MYEVVEKQVTVTRKEWTLDQWYEKALYVLGWVSFLYLAFYFCVGFFGELAAQGV
jgi:hypothetical protein